VDLDVIVTAEIALPEGYAFRAEGAGRVGRVLTALRSLKEPLRAPCLAYAVRHPTAGTILIDTGMHPDAARDLRRDFGGPMSVMFRGLRAADEPFDHQLRALDIDPGAVERVIMTHLHVDHTSGMRLLPRAEFTCSSEEWQATRGRLPAAKGYVPRHLPPRDRMKLVDFAADGEAHGPFARTIDLLGDGSIRLVSTPGHTAGHLSVLLRLREERTVLVVGDAAYTLRSIREQILPLLTADDEAAARSLHELARFAEDEPDAILVPTHDPDAWRQLG
jgi:glyoxylase-like metal-dependent hydrolase (beta-lactamase superfamily II)